MSTHVTDGYSQHPAWPESLIGPDLVAELDVLDGDVVTKTQPRQGLALQLTIENQVFKSRDMY